MVAPNGARRTKSDHPAIPVTIAETVRVAKACFEGGAGALHAHVRDQNGEHILDAGLYRELIGEMKVQVPAMDVQITTEAVGRYTPAQQRKLVRDLNCAAVSVGFAEMHCDNDTKAAHAFYRFAEDEKIAVQHIVYDENQLSQLLAAIDSDHIPARPQQMIFVLGRYTENQQSDPAMLQPYLDVIQSAHFDHDWSVCAFGSGETSCLEAAIKAGGKARVGFENSLWNQDGSVAASNMERVREVRALFGQ